MVFNDGASDEGVAMTVREGKISQIERGDFVTDSRSPCIADAILYRFADVDI